MTNTLLLFAGLLLIMYAIYDVHDRCETAIHYGGLALISLIAFIVLQGVRLFG